MIGNNKIKGNLQITNVYLAPIGTVSRNPFLHQLKLMEIFVRPKSFIRQKYLKK